MRCGVPCFRVGSRSGAASLLFVWSYRCVLGAARGCAGALRDPLEWGAAELASDL